MTVERIVALKRTYSMINPAATQRQIQALTAQLSALATSKVPGGNDFWSDELSWLYTLQVDDQAQLLSHPRWRPGLR